MAIPQENYSTSRAKMQVVPQVKQPKGHDVRELLDRDIPPREWLIPGILPTGATLLFARPKLGKSMFALTLALQVATGKSNIQGSALYLSLDDSDMDRFTERCRSILEGDEPPWDKLEVWENDVFRLDEGLIFQLKQHLNRRPDCKLIIVDVWANVKPKRSGDDIYQDDYQAMKMLHVFGREYKVGVLILHHTRKKRDEEDWMNNLNGSNGYPGAVDTVMMLDRPRGEKDIILRGRGRDFLDGDIMLRIQVGDMDAPWVDLNEVVSKDGESVPDRVLALLNSVGYPMSPKQIAATLDGVALNTVRQSCKRLYTAQKIQQTWYGLYASLSISQVRKSDTATYTPPIADDVTLTQTDKEQGQDSPHSEGNNARVTSDKNDAYVSHVTLPKFINPDVQEYLDILGEPWGEIENYQRHVAHYAEVGSPAFTIEIGNQSLTRKGTELMRMIKWLLDCKTKTIDGWEGQQYAARVLKTLGTL